MDVYEHDAGLVEIGQKVKLEFSAFPGESEIGVIDFINPILDPRSRTLKVRTSIENRNGRLKPGMIADGKLTVVFEGEPLVVPRTAVINTGKERLFGREFLTKALKLNWFKQDSNLRDI